ncbi:regulator of hemoglobinization and erythroid cell expansion protein [Lagenorhynchus albirostris]|uniref:regulator of hemoglobinization and erythroid cell expansion protein n=1 Tax=Lagenorhynchus albirostris TaxID=27610 RepID=UPI0028EF13C1|nr:regulator of hemoglobinization and erythroid cell expansion protein [Lagenorhynchus albirostris]
MLTEEMKVWHGIVIAVVSLVLQACLLAAVNYLLSRHMAKENERILKRAKHKVPRPSPAHCCPPAAKKTKEPRAERSTPMPKPHYPHDSDTSSDSSDSSDSSPPTHQATKDVNYTQVDFSAPGRRRNDSVLDYENIKEATDYVNVKPKSHKPGFWTFVNTGVFEPVEYSQVAM